MKKTYVQPIGWKNNKIRIVDQTRLPNEFCYEDLSGVSDVWKAIKKLKVRGAPLIGLAGAYGYCLGVSLLERWESAYVLKRSRILCDYLSSSRPTAVNLAWALKRMERVLRLNIGLGKAQTLSLLKKEVADIEREDKQMCFQMGTFGAGLIRTGDSLMTICNAGALATSGFGTALGVFYRAKQMGKRIKVYACETRPLLQGARLTAWELQSAGIDVTLLCDNMAADCMRTKKIKGVFVGADRIASNGDFANKIGTYGLAVLARYHEIPFYCVAPASTLDLSLHKGDDIPIEQRGPDEVTGLYFKKSIAPKGVKVFNPSFDVTPAALVSAMITEKGVIRPPFKENIKALYGV